MRKIPLVLGLGLTLALGVLSGISCSGSAGSSDGGGSGGSGGSSGGTGGSGGGSGSCNFPSCIASIASSCVPSGSCMYATAGTTTNMCFSNGVKMSTATTLTGAATTTVTKNGSACYTIETAYDVATMAITYTWKDKNGTVVGTGTAMPTSSTKISVKCGDMTTDFDYTSCTGGSGSGSDGGGCGMGTCD